MSLPPAPSREKDLTSPAWQKWFSLIQETISPIATGGAQLWSSISKSGSNLTHIETRSHGDLQNLNSDIAAHPTQEQLDGLTGGASTDFHKHNHELLDNLDTTNYSHITAVEKSLIPSGVPSAGKSPVATSETTSSWQTPTVSNVISAITAIPVDTTYTVAGYLRLDSDLAINGNLLITG